MKTRALWSITLSLALFFVGTGVVLAQDTVPDVVGLRLDAAERLLEQASCEWAVNYDSAGAQGVVMRQSPAGLSPYSPGTSVVITVGGTTPTSEPETNLGPAPTQPREPDQPVDPSQPTELDRPVEPGPVIQPNPRPAGVLDLPRARTVSTVGPKVPSVLGEQFSSATRTLGAWNVDRELSVSVPELVGKIVNQWPTPGNTLASGETIIVVVAVAKRPTNDFRFIPNVRGKSILDAKAELEQAGFAVALQTVESPVEEFSRAVWQKPMPGSIAPLGSTVIVDVGRGSDTAPTPASVDPLPADPAPAGPDDPGTPPAGNLPDMPVPPIEPDVPTPAPLPPEDSTPKAVLGGPKLLSPPKGESYPRAYGATFEWASVRGATSYEWELQEELPTGAWQSVETKTLEEGNRHRPDRMKRGRFRWRVRAFAGDVAGKWSGWFRLYMY